ncbi:hypothetical protein VKT23_007519 [Stygiomarasmius scandens]|uniref:Late embryogenesis abundant protein LEA-2 subgroup domain-containing protein n=1 Tax=Marasmiellus scandens TaxID=2682957 RepID=A0ABR1JKQ1_9AGAR
MPRRSWLPSRPESGHNLSDSYAFTFNPRNSSQSPNLKQSIYNHESDPFARTLELSLPLDTVSQYPEAGLSNAGGGNTFSIWSKENMTASGNVKQYRQQYQGNLWTRGSGGRRALRFISCTILIALYLFLGIALSLILFLRPPNAAISKPDIKIDQTALIQSPQKVVTGLTLPLQVNISISNPSFISATAKNVSVSVWYKVNDTSKFKIGNGTISNKVIKPNARTNITFPIDITYTTDLDPHNAVLGDLLEKCVFNNQGFDFNINVDVKASILGVTIAPKTISLASIHQACPVDTTPIQSLLKSADEITEELANKRLLDVFIDLIHVAAERLPSLIG